MKIWLKNWGTFFLYEWRLLVSETIGGIRYRVKIYPKLFKQFLKKFTAWILAFFALFGLTFQAIYSFLRPLFQSFLEWFQTSFITQIPLSLKWIIGILLSLIFIIFIVRRLISKESLFRIATRRLRDRIEKEDQSASLKDNFEAEVLIRDVIDTGRWNINAYDFLIDLWLPSIESHKCLSMLTISDQRGNSLMPIVSVDIQHLRSDPLLPEGLLNSIIKVQEVSRFKDYSGKESDYDLISGQAEKFYIRKPVCRYLTRYKGPNSDQTGFADDYTGYNACLRKMNFQDGELNLPIECTTELYGNIMDSSDSLINETYMHFSFDKYSGTVSPDVVLSHLPWRKAIHRKHKNPVDILTQVKGRAAGFGISALTVVNEKGKFFAIRGLRTTKVGVFPNVFHVIPSGMANIEKDYSDLIENGYLNLQLLFENEFLEEVFNYKKAVSHQIPFEPWAKNIKKEVQEKLYGFNNEYQAHIYLTGIVFNLLNYRPEVCALILIKNEKWWDDKYPILNLSYEWMEKTRSIDIFNDYEVLSAMPLNKSVPAGVAAFHLGIQKARILLS